MAARFPFDDLDLFFGRGGGIGQTIIQALRPQLEPQIRQRFPDQRFVGDAGFLSPAPVAPAPAPAPTPITAPTPPPARVEAPPPPSPSPIQEVLAGRESAPSGIGGTLISKAGPNFSRAKGSQPF